LIALGPLIAIDGRDGCGPSSQEAVMATVGKFVETGEFTGTVKTLTLNVNAKITATGKESEKALDYRVLVSQAACGAASKKTANAGRKYLSVKLDDPHVPAPIFASLVEVEGSDSHALIWSRRNGD
jgi:uncharacterized protein (DUF736 family)